MSKFTKQDKVKAAKRYLQGKEGYREIASELGIDHKSIVKWVKQYQHQGAKAFTNKCTTYTPEFKMEVLNYMTEKQTSLSETAAIFNIPAHQTVARWAKKFEKVGQEAFRPNEKRYTSMKNKTESPLTKKSVKELEDENNYLKMENAYLKKLNALTHLKKELPAKIKRR